MTPRGRRSLEVLHELVDAVVNRLRERGWSLPEDGRDRLLGAIREVAAGTAVYVPRMDPSELERRNREIRELAAQGMPVRRLALRYGLAMRTVYDILKQRS